MPSTFSDEAIACFPFFDRLEVIEMNLRFYHAMIDARRAGTEKFTIGIQTDDTPFAPTHFARVQYHSGMGSSAQSCIDEMPTERFGRIKARGAVK